MATILVADDNADLRELVKLHLQKNGFACVEACSGAEVLDALAAERIDLVLMDLNMPVLDGWEATVAIRSSQEFASTPVVALTAYSLAGDRARAKAAGFSCFHVKPIQFDELLADINRLLQPPVESAIVEQ